MGLGYKEKPQVPITVQTTPTRWQNKENKVYWI